MTVWIVTEKPDHVVIRQVAQLLGCFVETLLVDPGSPPPHGVPDLILLKSYSEAGLRLARMQQCLGIKVINDPDAVVSAVDRVQMAARAKLANVPFPSSTLTTVNALRNGDLGVEGPWVAKSRFSRGDDLVLSIKHIEQLASLDVVWDNEPIVVQPQMANDGFDHKIFVVGNTLFHDRRTSALTNNNYTYDIESTNSRSDISEETISSLSNALRRSFALEIFGFDVIVTNEGPLVVDVNPFPGARGVPGVADAIVDLARQQLSELSISNVSYRT